MLVGSAEAWADEVPALGPAGGHHRPGGLQGLECLLDGAVGGTAEAGAQLGHGGQPPALLAGGDEGLDIVAHPAAQECSIGHDPNTPLNPDVLAAVT
jgi:hypothetical protein